MAGSRPGHTPAPAARARLYGTLFYANYLTRAIALYRSLERHCGGEFELVMLCMDAAALRICQQLDLPRARLVSVQQLERRDAELAAVKPLRTIAEYCFTCAPPLLIYLLDQVAPGETVVYLDADLMFFADPQAIFEEWGDNDIAIHEHRLPPGKRDAAELYGVFNVGWVGIRNSPEGRRCLERWRRQCIEACTFDPARGLCHDQKYLDEWPALYRGLTVLQNKGVGIGPWNAETYEFSSTDGAPQVDGVPLIFYHFHAMSIAYDNVFGRIAIVPAPGYPLSRSHMRLVYEPYARALRAAQREVSRTRAGGRLPLKRPSLWTLVKMMRWTHLVYSR
jgi:hypothetical protein